MFASDKLLKQRPQDLHQRLRLGLGQCRKAKHLPHNLEARDEREHQGRTLRRDALVELRPLTGLLERDESFLSIVRDSPDDGLALRWRRRWRAPASLLLAIAQAMAELVCEADFAHIKTCEGAACTLVFLDKTRDHRRRWCSMAVCGNRAKQAAHRERNRYASAERR